VDQARPGKRVEPSAYERAVGILAGAGQQITTTIDELTPHEAIHFAALIEASWTTRQLVELRNLARARK
jgi:hypothetical protein